MTRSFKRKPLSIFLDHAKKLDMDPRDLTEAIGFHRSTFTNWQDEGNTPECAAIAAECIVRRNGNNLGRERFVIIRFKDGEIEDYREMSVKPMTLRFNDQGHYLIPVLKS